ncbi:MAG: hypothetical protein HRT57_07815, partial [Crocinitomicaceae bacterium]|nr:hypothetical protein [Crocinitomicaceae bacterium]
MIIKILVSRWVLSDLRFDAKLAGQEITPGVTVRNMGNITVDGFEVQFEYNGTQLNKNVSGILLAPMQTMDVEFSSAITVV